MRRLYLFFLFLGFAVSNTTGCSCKHGCGFNNNQKLNCAPDFSAINLGTGGSTGSSDGCLPGQACGDNGVCSDDNVCCTATICGGACCGGTEVCAFDHCVSPGKTCQTSSDCPDGSGCDYTLGGLAAPPNPGVCAPTPQTGVCLPRPPDCMNGEIDSSSCLPVCLAPPLPPFAPPTTIGSFGDASADGDHVASLPVVVPLLDESCDGRIDELDVPGIVFTTFSASKPEVGAVVHAMVMKDGALVPRWTVGPDATSPTDPASALAAGNIDGSTGTEVVFCTLDHRVHALRADAPSSGSARPRPHARPRRSPISTATVRWRSSPNRASSTASLRSERQPGGRPRHRGRVRGRGRSRRQKNAGLRVLGAPGYARTRRIWNEHGYHGINVLGDGRIPELEGRLVHGFREAPVNGDAPDLVLTLLAACNDPFMYVIDVRNVGQARVPAGVPVVLSGGVDGTTALGKGATTKALAPGEGESIRITIDPAVEQVNVQATVGGKASPAQLDECREDNNHTLQSPGCEL